MIVYKETVNASKMSIVGRSSEGFLYNFSQNDYFPAGLYNPYRWDLHVNLHKQYNFRLNAKNNFHYNFMKLMM